VEYDGAARVIRRELELTVNGRVETASSLGLVVSSDDGELWSCGYDGERRELLPACGHVLASHGSRVAIADRGSTAGELVLLDIEVDDVLTWSFRWVQPLSPWRRRRFRPMAKRSC
jgi:hypothetical protein